VELRHAHGDVELVLGAEADAGKGIPQVGERIDA